MGEIFFTYAMLSLKAKVERPVTPSPIPTPKAKQKSHLPRPERGRYIWHDSWQWQLTHTIHILDVNILLLIEKVQHFQGSSTDT